MRILKLAIVFILFYSASAVATIIEKIEVENNNRISKETIITYGDVKLNKDYNNDDINQILKKLYETNFLNNIEITILENILNIRVVENKIIQTVKITGIKSKTIQSTLLENLFSKDKSPSYLQEWNKRQKGSKITR